MLIKFLKFQSSISMKRTRINSVEVEERREQVNNDDDDENNSAELSEDEDVPKILFNGADVDNHDDRSSINNWQF